MSCFISTAVILNSCESNKHISVKVTDAVSGDPLDSVLVQVNAGKNGNYTLSQTSGYTDVKGQFDSYLMIGCSFGCYDIYIEYTREGYQDRKDLNITSGEVQLTPK